MNKIYLILLFVVVFQTNVYAEDNLRCGTKLISIGSTQQFVLDECGAPDFVQKSVVSGTKIKSTTTVSTDALNYPNVNWFYSHDKNELRHIVRFEGGVISSIAKEYNGVSDSDLK